MTVTETESIVTTQLINQTIINSTDRQISSINYYSFSCAVMETEPYSFSIYIYNDETLHLYIEIERYPEGDNGSYTPLRMDIITPSGESLHSYGTWSLGEYADGTLCEYACQPFSLYTTRFSPSYYDWGEGYYRFTIRSDDAEDLVQVKVEYWIEK
jgi:hypothetical protein